MGASAAIDHHGNGVCVTDEGSGLAICLLDWSVCHCICNTEHLDVGRDARGIVHTPVGMHTLSTRSASMSTAPLLMPGTTHEGGDDLVRF